MQNTKIKITFLSFLISNSVLIKDFVTNQFNNDNVMFTMNTENTKNVLDYIEYNKFLSKEEKEFLKSFEEFFNERSYLFDMDLVALRLSTLDIHYTGNINKLVLASYNKNTNIITVNNYNSFNEDIKNVLFHEFLHSLTSKDLDAMDKYLFDEFTEELALRYRHKNSDGQTKIYPEE